MDRVKIVRKYVSKSEIAKVKAYQKRLARSENRLVLKVETVDACDFFRANKEAAKRLFKDWAHPQVGEYIVIVHYCMDVCIVNKKRSIKEKIKKAVRERNEAKVFFVIKLDKKKSDMMKVVALNYTTNFSVPAYKFRYYTTPTNKKPSRFEIPRSTSEYRFAA
jgi:hypothetical protein